MKKQDKTIPSKAMAKLIIIRGNSGSGKSSVAQALRQRAKHKTAVIEQDMIRRQILKVKDKPGSDYPELIEHIASFCLDRQYSVVIEGILYSQTNLPMIKRIISWPGVEAYIYYLDIPFEETLKRHQTKPNAHDYGEPEMREWYIEDDRLGLPGEKVFGPQINEEELVKQILTDTKLDYS